MTEQEWSEKCRERIRVAMRKARRMSLRELKRTTHYDRGKCEGAVAIWHDAVESLEQAGDIRFEQAGKRIAFQDWTYGPLQVIWSEKRVSPS